jgi:hypothetical protein
MTSGLSQRAGAWPGFSNSRPGRSPQEARRLSSRWAAELRGGRRSVMEPAAGSAPATAVSTWRHIWSAQASGTEPSSRASTSSSRVRSSIGLRAVADWDPSTQTEAVSAASRSADLVPVAPMFTSAERLALAGCLAAYGGLTRQAYERAATSARAAMATARAILSWKWSSCLVRVLVHLASRADARLWRTVRVSE